MIKVLLVDDHELVRVGIKSLLAGQRDISVIAEANSGEQAVHIAREKCPDIVLMDVKMPGIGGLEATHKLLRQHPNLKIIIVTACDEDPFPSRLLQAGAAGYITKDSGPDKIIEAIRKVYSGQRYISAEVAQQLALKHLSDGSRAFPFDVLSKRELQVMLMIVNGYKVLEISQKLCLSPKTVNTYRYRIFEKLKIENDVELTHLALRYNMVDNVDKN